MSVSTEKATTIIINIANVMEENKQYLTDLDAAIGDGDHGINMAKGFKAVTEKLTQTSVTTIGDLFKLTSMALISHVGGASGPLYGTFFMKAAIPAKDLKEMRLSDFYAALNEGIEGIKMRGKATIGEKTMLDVLIPALNSLKESVDHSISPNEALCRMVTAAQKGMEHTKEIAATKGRASYVGERSIGHVDPGAMSSYLMLKTLYETLYNISDPTIKMV